MIKTQPYCRFVLMVTFLLFAVNTLSAENRPTPFSYEVQWSKVTQYSKANRPESAMKEVEIILMQAKSENNSVQFIKASVQALVLTLKIEPDKAPAQIAKFDSLIGKATNPSDKALLQSMTAELYVKYYATKTYAINNRTEVVGQTPGDLEQWTKNKYSDTIRSLLAESLQNAEQLQKTDIEKYQALLNSVDNKQLEPTLYDLLAKRKIKLLTDLKGLMNEPNLDPNLDLLFLPSDKFFKAEVDTKVGSPIGREIIRAYQQWLEFRVNDTNTEALIHTDINRMADFNNLLTRGNQYDSNGEMGLNARKTAYIAALDALEAKFSNNEQMIKIHAIEAVLYQSQYNSNDSIRKYYLRKAYDICADGIARFPNGKNIMSLKNLQNHCIQKIMYLSNNQVAKPHTTLEIELVASNLDRVELKIYRVNTTAQEYYKNMGDNEKNTSPLAVLIEKRWIDLKKDPNFIPIKTIIPIKTGDYGIYEFTLGTNDNPIEQIRGKFVVSDLAYMTQSATKTQYCVVDRVSGKPAPNVQINSYITNWEKGKVELTPCFLNGLTNSMGIFEYSVPKNNYTNTVQFYEKGADKYLSSEYREFRYNSVRYEKKSLLLNVFTDRTLYRLGQTIYFKGIAYYSTADVQEVAADESIEIKLLDANRKQIAVKTLRTNEFGSFADSFILPDDGLNGCFTLQTNYSYTYFWVEAYKRPTFEVTMEQPKTEVHFEDSIKVQGKVMAFSGYPVSDVNVTYQIVRRSHYRYLGRMSQNVISNGTVQTSAEGTFTVVFKAQKNNKVVGDQFYTYDVSTTVTDQKGETQKGEQSISVGDKSLFIVSDLSNVVKMDKAKEKALDVHLVTLNNEQVEGTVHYELLRLEQPDVYVDKAYLNPVKEDRGTSVLSGNFETKDGKLKLDLKNLDSGYYRMVFFTLDNRQDTVEMSKKFTLFSMNDKRPPVKTYSWCMVSKRSLSEGENAVIQFGSSANQVHALFQIMKADSILESKWFTVSDEIRTFEFPFLGSYGMGVSVLFTFVKDEQLFAENILLNKKVEKRELSPKLTVFRDKLQPGVKAEWTINIPEVVNKKDQAELLVDMYDASLDAIHPYYMYFDPAYRAYLPMAPRWNSTISQKLDRTYREKQKLNTFSSKPFSDVDWMGLNFRSMVRNVSVATVRGVDSEKGVDIADLEDHQLVIEEKPVLSVSSIDNALQGRIAGLDIIANSGIGISEPSTTIRTNFNETAFFYPQLRTDEQGNVKFSFTVPESLTRWNVKMLAHTKDLFSGIAESHVVTQKDLMVQLNLPRFVRRSDKLVVRASVANLTDTVQNTRVKLELSDPENGKPIDLKDGLTKFVALAAQETKFVEWELTEFAPYEMVVCKVVATSEAFSDGEQRYLPVLPDQVLITETLPMTVRANQTKNFTMENLLKNGSNVSSQSLTVEFSPNPAWYAVQALPTLSISENDNAFDYFTAYYVNTLAAYIANSNPKLSAVFDRWKQSSQDRNALLSNLEKNKELKSMLLEETPWLLTAQNETQQKRQIALLFDLNQQKQQNTLYWDKLLKLQMSSGGFSWFEGMPANRYVTQYILLNAARLNSIVKTSATSHKAAILNAIAFIDNEISRDYEQQRLYNDSYKTTMTIGDIQWFYLHVRSEYPEVPIPDFARDAVVYYTTQAQKYWQNATLYGKAASALIAARNHNRKLASQILVSLKENAVKSDEMGMYWARNTPGYFWNQRPVMVQAMMLEAFSELTKNTADLDEMKIWLLRQKQTQCWDSQLSTVDAIYALLHYGTEWISTANEVAIQLGSTTIRTDQKEAGSGYVKQTVEGSKVTPQMALTKIELKGTSGFGWGALYWQYFQNLNQVQQSGNALTVSKKLFVEQLLPTGKAMIPIEKTTLKLGDKVITRLVVTVDRDMEYVALKDLRAACFEPVKQLSGCVWKEGVSYYQTTKDASTQFFFASLPKGTYVFEYEVWVNNAGKFTSGITTLQCQYAPEFSAHSGGERLVVSEK